MEEKSYTSTHPLVHTGPLTGSLYLLVPLESALHPIRALIVNVQPTALTLKVCYMDSGN